MLRLFHLAVFVIVFLALSSKAQDADEVRLILQELLDGQNNLLARMEGLQNKQTNMEEQQRFTNDVIIELRNTMMADECEDGTNECSEFATCTDTCGYYKCSCHPGYSGDGFSCTDINECSEGGDLCTIWGTCINTPGSYSCSCEEGFQEDERTCRDIDECSEGRNLCGFGSICVNSLGSFNCICQDGFKRNEEAEEAGTCQDINECEEYSYECDEHASCINNNGSYSCKCNQFYKGNGVTCQGPFCRSPFVAISGVGCIFVDTSQLTWQESKGNCQRIYGRLMEDITNNQLAVLSKHYKGKFRYIIWVGIRKGRWVTSNEPIAQELWGRGEPSDYNRSCANVDMSTGHLYELSCDVTTYSLCQQLPDVN